MKVLKENQGTKLFFKSSLIAISILLMSVCCKAQEQTLFPFQGGADIMTRFFKDSLTVSPEIVDARAAGTVIFKFTADNTGTITRMVIYYADDYILTPPIIEALRKSTHKWIIPDREKTHEFILPFNVSFNMPAKGIPSMKAFYTFYMQRKPISAANEIPVGSATLLPTVMVTYDIVK